MRRWVELLKHLAHDSRAATAVEYALILALMVLAMFAGLQAVASSTVTMWSNVSTKVQDAH